MNGELLGGKSQDATLVWIMNILLYSWAAFSLAYGSWKYHTHSCNNSRYCMLTHVIRYSIVCGNLERGKGKTMFPSLPGSITGTAIGIWDPFTIVIPFWFIDSAIFLKYTPGHLFPSRLCWPGVDVVREPFLLRKALMLANPDYLFKVFGRCKFPRWSCKLDTFVPQQCTITLSLAPSMSGTSTGSSMRDRKRLAPEPALTSSFETLKDSDYTWEVV